MDTFVPLFSAALAVIVPTFLALLAVRLVEGDDE